MAGTESSAPVETAGPPSSDVVRENGSPLGEAARPPGRLPITLRSLRHRNFQLFFGGQLISLVGTWMQSIAQSWLVYRLTGSSLLLGVVSFVSQIPIFLLSPVGGTIADRSIAIASSSPRRRLP